MTFEERIKCIKENRDKCYTGIWSNPFLRHALPQLHKDCYWLLEQVHSIPEEEFDFELIEVREKLK